MKGTTALVFGIAVLVAAPFVLPFVIIWWLALWMDKYRGLK